MKSFKKLLASLIARATKRMGIAACGCASMYGGYQTKEPDLSELFERRDL